MVPCVKMACLKCHNEWKAPPARGKNTKCLSRQGQVAKSASSRWLVMSKQPGMDLFGEYSAMRKGKAHGVFKLKFQREDTEELG